MPTENVAVARAQSPQNLHALDGVDVAVQVAHLQADVAQVVGEILGGALGQRGDEHALAQFDTLAAKLDRLRRSAPLSGRTVIFGPAARSGG